MWGGRGSVTNSAKCESDKCLFLFRLDLHVSQVNKIAKAWRTFHGKVDGYDAAREYWHIKYSDGDAEDRDIDDMADEMLDEEDPTDPPSSEISFVNTSNGNTSSPDESTNTSESDVSAAGSVITTATVRGGGPAQEQDYLRDV